MRANSLKQRCPALWYSILHYIDCYICSSIFYSLRSRVINILSKKILRQEITAKQEFYVMAK